MGDMVSRELAYESTQLRKDYLAESADWREEAWDNDNFYHGAHWTVEMVDKLKKRGQYPYKIDKVSPIIENKIASVMAHEPTWDIRPIGWGADEFRAIVRRMILRRVWYYSDGRTQYRDGSENSFVCGRGVVGIRWDALADYGAGEIVLFTVRNPHEILVDPNCTSRDWEDADNLIFAKVMTLGQAKRFLPDEEYWSAIKSQVGVDTVEEISEKVNRYKGESQKHRGDFDYNPQDKVLMIERYTKEIAKFHVLTPTVQGLAGRETEKLTDDDKRNVANGYYVETIVRRPRIRRICSVGNEFLYDDEMPITRYPFAPIIHRHTGNPFSLGEIVRIKDQQISLNKKWAVFHHIVATSANPRIIYPEGSIVPDVWANEAAMPGALLPYYPQYDQGVPKEMTMNVATPTSVLGHMMEIDARNMQDTAGIYPPDMGSSEGAPRALGQTLVFKRNQEKRLRDFTATALDPAIVKMANVVLEMVPAYYTPEKLKKVVDAELSDPHLTDDQKQHLSKVEHYADEILNNVTMGRYDVQIVPGSTMDEDPVAILQHFFEMADRGAMNRATLIRQDPYIKDKEGLIRDLNEQDQLKAQLEQMGSINERQGQTIQMLENEVRHAKMDRDVSANKAALKGEELKARSHVKLMKDRDELTRKIKDAEATGKATPQKKKEK